MPEQKMLIDAYLLIDAANQKDPNTELVIDTPMAKEFIYGVRMTAILETFTPNASIALRIAARCQHICRWEIPRDRYPMDRAGYLKWRVDLRKFHADKASVILEKVGFEPEIISRVSFLVQKKQLKRDTETQALEDVICLVFLNFYFDDFIEKHPKEKVVDIIQKTWKKMSEKGHKAALEISYTANASDLIHKAIQ